MQILFLKWLWKSRGTFSGENKKNQENEGKRRSSQTLDCSTEKLWSFAAAFPLMLSPPQTRRTASRGCLFPSSVSSPVSHGQKWKHYIQTYLLEPEPRGLLDPLAFFSQMELHSLFSPFQQYQSRSLTVQCPCRKAREACTKVRAEQFAVFKWD